MLSGPRASQQVSLEKAEIGVEIRSHTKRRGGGAARPQGPACDQRKEPTAMERALHELTHMPYRAWRDHCIAVRGLQDRHQQLSEGSDRDTPTIAFDIAYTGVSGDSKSDAGHKLAIYLKQAAVELTRFVQSLGHATISLQTDNEPSTLALQDLVASVRTRLGFKTLVRDAAVE